MLRILGLLLSFPLYSGLRIVERDAASSFMFTPLKPFQGDDDFRSGNDLNNQTFIDKNALLPMMQQLKERIAKGEKTEELLTQYIFIAKELDRYYQVPVFHNGDEASADVLPDKLADEFKELSHTFDGKLKGEITKLSDAELLGYERLKRYFGVNPAIADEELYKRHKDNITANRSRLLELMGLPDAFTPGSKSLAEIDKILQSATPVERANYANLSYDEALPSESIAIANAKVLEDYIDAGTRYGHNFKSFAELSDNVFDYQLHDDLNSRAMIHGAVNHGDISRSGTLQDLPSSTGVAAKDAYLDKLRKDEQKAHFVSVANSAKKPYISNPKLNSEVATEFLGNFPKDDAGKLLPEYKMSAECRAKYSKLKKLNFGLMGEQHESLATDNVAMDLEAQAKAGNMLLFREGLDHAQSAGPNIFGLEYPVDYGLSGMIATLSKVTDAAKDDRVARMRQHSLAQDFLREIDNNPYLKEKFTQAFVDGAPAGTTFETRREEVLRLSVTGLSNITSAMIHSIKEDLKDPAKSKALVAKDQLSADLSANQRKIADSTLTELTSLPSSEKIEKAMDVLVILQRNKNFVQAMIKKLCEQDLRGKTELNVAAFVGDLHPNGLINMLSKALLANEVSTTVTVFTEDAFARSFFNRSGTDLFHKTK